MNTIKIAVLSCFLTLTAFAGGFEINEHNSRAMGMGGAFTAVANDASAIYFNAAGLNQLKGFHLLVGTTLIAPSFSFQGVAPEANQYEGETQYFFPIHFYASYAASEDLSFGLGFTTPFGLGTKWDENWVGKYLAIETNLQTFILTPVVAYRVLDNLSVSAGFVYSFANVKITRKSSQGVFPGDAFVTLDGKDNSAFGYNFGLLYKPTNELSFGASFHSEIKYTFDGTAKTVGASQLMAVNQLPNGDVQAELTTPMYFNIGAAYKAMDNLTLSAEYQYIGWSSYDTLRVNFNDGKYPNIASPRLYKNSFIIRFGAEYVMDNGLSIQAGLYYDKMPVETQMLNPTLPEANRLGTSFGIGYKISNQLSVNASYLNIYSKKLAVNNSEEMYTGGIAPFNGVYKAGANLGSLSLSYNF